jgi:DNA-binding response OmpR family regulator
MMAVYLNIDSVYNVLIVDDDKKLHGLLQRYLNDNGFNVKTCFNASEMNKIISREFFHLIVLDLMIPGETGLQACSRLRSQGNNTPILMLTAKGGEIDRIIGLEMGCDDYLPKPFNPRELIARINSIIKRYYALPPGSPEPKKKIYPIGKFSLDVSQRTLISANTEITLTTGQFALLKHLVINPHRPVSRDELVMLIKKRNRAADERSVDVQISRLRKIIENDPKSPRYLQTVWAYGYVFVPDDVGA